MEFRTLTLLCLLAVLQITRDTEATDLQVGSTVNNVLAYTEEVKLSAVPMKIRTKNVFYNSPSLATIKGISAVDQDKSPATAIVTAGGVGSTFANVRIKSERGDGINYQVQFYV